MGSACFARGRDSVRRPPWDIFVGWVAITSESEYMHSGAVRAGTVIATGSFVDPYIEMFGVLQARPVGFLLLGGVWIGLLGLCGY